MTKAKIELSKLIKQFNGDYNEDTLNQEGFNALRKKKRCLKGRSEYDLMEMRSLTKTSKEIIENIKSSDCTLKADQYATQSDLCQMLISVCGTIEGLITEAKP